MNPKRKTEACVREANGLTTCCAAYTKFIDGVECCKGCFHAVENEQEPIVVLLPPRSR